MSISVLRDVATAKDHLRRNRSRIPSGNSEPSSPIGDEGYVFTSSTLTAGIRWKNTVIDIYMYNELDAARATLTKLDDIMRNDRMIAPLGRFATPPRITKLSVAEKAAGERHTRANLQCVGFGSSPPNIIALADSSGLVRQNVSADGDCKLEIPDHPRYENFDIVVGNDDNLFIRQRIVRQTGFVSANTP